MDSFSALILAKGESKRLTNKNTLDFHGKPMFMVNVDKWLNIFERVYVSSDSAEILDTAEAAGAIGIYRKSHLCGDTPNILVYQHALEHMDCAGIVAVQANSPTLEANKIVLAKRIMEMGVDELMTCWPTRRLYGSIWGLTADKLENYDDPYEPTPSVLIIDDSIDIHLRYEYNQALC